MRSTVQCVLVYASQTQIGHYYCILQYIAVEMDWGGSLVNCCLAFIAEQRYGRHVRKETGHIGSHVILIL